MTCESIYIILILEGRGHNTCVGIYNQTRVLDMVLLLDTGHVTRV